ncbi:MAG: hypothetical protein ACOC0N_09590 [Chroococcales cyanobacterium]
MPTEQADYRNLEPATKRFYCDIIQILQHADIPFLVGGSYALEYYTHIPPNTKDLDVFVRLEDSDRLLALFKAKEYQTEIPIPHWLGKIHQGKEFVDVIFNSPSGNNPVNDTWFNSAVEAEIFGIPIKLCSPEDLIRSKAFIMERKRWDGSDIAHIIHACGNHLNWSYLIGRFRNQWRILLSHLILFGFIYPGKRSQIPNWVMQELLQRLHQEMLQQPPADTLCQGTLLSATQYLIDVEQWGYEDARLHPWGNLTATEIDQWTAAVQENA